MWILCCWLVLVLAAAYLLGPMEEEQVVTAATDQLEVLVPREAAAELFAHLRAQGRVTSFTSTDDAHTKLGSILGREWGTAKCKRFQDAAGGGWLVDISAFVDGEALYALVRTVFGRRTLMTVVDEEEVEEFSSNREWKRPAAKSTSPPGIDEAAVREANAIEAGRAPRAERRDFTHPTEVPRAPAPVTLLDPREPVLVLVIRGGEAGDDPVIDHSVRCTREEVPGVVKMLLRKGYNGSPVSEEQIEVWGSLSRPKLEVKF